MNSLASNDRKPAAGVLFRWHRRLGVIACLGILMWGVSGVLHPFMSRLKPEQATHTPPAQHVELTQAVPLGQLLAQHSLTGINGFRTLLWAGKSYYQILHAGRVLYFESATGAAVPDGDQRYAEFLARHYLGDQQSSIRRIEPVTQFGGDYTFVNRFLPVYRVEFERPDGMLAYIDTQASRLGTLVDDRKAIFQDLFRTLHNWEFLAFNETLRVTAAASIVGVAFISACSGLWLYGFLWRRGTTTPSMQTNSHRLRRHHRTIGLTVAVAALMFSMSGLLHLLTDAQRRQAQAPAVTADFPAAAFTPAGFSAMQNQAIAADHVTLVRLPQGIYYRIAPALQHHSADAHHTTRAESPTPHTPVVYIDASSGTPLAQGEALHAHYLSGVFSELPDSLIESSAPVMHYMGEYGAFYKRLPVYRVNYATPARDRYYVEPSTGQLAGHFQDSTFVAVEDWTFDNLHKWHFLDKLGPDKWVRDIVMALLALGLVTVALLGLMLFLRRAPRAP